MSHEALHRRIDEIADMRERERLGRGYYPTALRARAKALASSLLTAAGSHGVTLSDLNAVGDLPAEALDVLSLRWRRADGLL